MSAVPVETPKQAAARLAAGAIRDGFRPAGLHCYCNAEGNPVFWRIRCKHPDTGEKWIRPMHWNGTGYNIGELPAPEAGKLLYRLPELLNDPAAIVWIVEGEACADALARLGMIATTSGGGTSADAADWMPLQGRHVRIWPDHDKPGADYADAVEARLHAQGCRVERLDVENLGLPDKGDCVDWLRAYPEATAADVDALPLVRDSARAGKPAPEPMCRPTPPPAPYPLMALGEVLYPAAQSICRVIQAPDAIIGGSLLAAASLAVQGQANVEMDGRSYPLSLWLLSVADSGERKSAVDAEAMRPARIFEAEIGQEHEAKREIHDADMAEWEAKRDAIKREHTSKGKSGAGLSAALRQLGPKPPAPLLPMVTADDITAEGLFKLLAMGRPSIGAFTDEAAKVFGGHAMRSETVMGTVGFLCGLWDRGAASRVRVEGGASKLVGRRFAMHLLAQPVIAERALSDAVLSGQGFLARCLLAWPEGTAGSRNYVAESLRDDSAMQRYTDVLLARFRQALPVADGNRQELTPRALRLSPQAAKGWQEIYATVEAQERTGGRFAHVKGWASKTAEQAARIAGVLTLIEAPEAQVIEADTMERAGELAIWHLMEAERLAGAAELSSEIRDAEALQQWAWATRREHVYSTDALNKGPSRIRDRNRLKAAMTVLESAGWATKVNGGMVLDGRQRQNVWRMLPESEGG